MQRLLRAVFPPQCIGCGDMVESEGALCGPCWRDTRFITGVVCDCCGSPLMGEVVEGETLYCDECLEGRRVWDRGRAAFLYKDTGRKLVLALKHGDRLDVVKPAAEWMSRAAEEIVDDDTIVAPIPLHWTRFMKRRFNQSALLSKEIANNLHLEHVPELLRRVKRTQSLEGQTAGKRRKTLSNAIMPHPKYWQRMEGRSVLLVDDVLTTGATINAAARACIASLASEVNVIALARVERDS
ncbi:MULTISPECIES: ComF family protein [Halocynthiibacter]|uniref:ComF family protein n=1 Tax=Halocynthiibacter halioticoli TaxID=2986804 RepID=A0AAE3J079_9RHOB|nr:MULTISPECIES: ComF family protein [Halocynthiibacter]MCV6825577.1 ComF family protein [Halocynthiibacter halioticoli]MCW4058578.1 ComF family protein [Halocynthiibacter sp. SDUM655004]